MKKDEMEYYCFGYTVNDIESDALTNSRSLIIKKVSRMGLIQKDFDVFQMFTRW